MQSSPAPASDSILEAHYDAKSAWVIGGASLYKQAIDNHCITDYYITKVYRPIKFSANKNPIYFPYDINDIKGQEHKIFEGSDYQMVRIKMV